MSKKYILIIVFILVIIAGGVYYFWNKQQHGENTGVNITYPQTSNYTFYSIHEIKQNKFSSGTYNTEGNVVKIYTCPPCPTGAQCKPCMRDNIVISENNQILETYSLSDKEIILFADNPKQFELGKKYQFSIKILDYKSTGEPVNDAEIIGYNSLSQNGSTTSVTIAPLSDNLSCKEMYDEIESDLDKSNFCQTNSDCDAIMLGGAYVKFGCYHYINKGVDKELIYQKMSVYDKKCNDMINKCAPAPTAQCVSNKCIKAQ